MLGVSVNTQHGATAEGSLCKIDHLRNETNAVGGIDSVIQSVSENMERILLQFP
jgi:hypothetical protein